MAKKPKEPTKKKPTAPAPAPAITRQLTNEKDLNTLLKRCESHRKQTAELTGELAGLIAIAVEKKFLHKKAFATIRVLSRMEPPKLREWLDHFDHYLEATGLQERAESAPGLPLDASDGEDADDGEKAGEPENVARPSFGAVGGGNGGARIG